MGNAKKMAIFLEAATNGQMCDGTGKNGDCVESLLLSEDEEDHDMIRESKHPSLTTKGNEDININHKNVINKSDINNYNNKNDNINKNDNNKDGEENGNSSNYNNYYNNNIIAKNMDRSNDNNANNNGDSSKNKSKNKNKDNN